MRRVHGSSRCCATWLLLSRAQAELLVAASRVAGWVQGGRGDGGRCTTQAAAPRPPACLSVACAAAGAQPPPPPPRRPQPTGTWRTSLPEACARHRWCHSCFRGWTSAAPRRTGTRPPPVPWLRRTHGDQGCAAAEPPAGLRGQAGEAVGGWVGGWPAVGVPGEPAMQVAAGGRASAAAAPPRPPPQNQWWTLPRRQPPPCSTKARESMASLTHDSWGAKVEPCRGWGGGGGWMGGWVGGRPPATTGASAATSQLTAVCELCDGEPGAPPVPGTHRVHGGCGVHDRAPTLAAVGRRLAGLSERRRGSSHGSEAGQRQRADRCHLGGRARAVARPGRRRRGAQGGEDQASPAVKPPPAPALAADPPQAAPVIA